MSEPKQYRKKPVTIEAMRMPIHKDPDAVREVALWMVYEGYDANPEGYDLNQWDSVYVITNSDGSLTGLPEFGTNFLEIETLEGCMSADLGDYIIKGVQGEFYPCRADIFAQTYEEVGNA